MNDVTSSSHPTLYEALDMISHDMGNGAGWTSYPIPDDWWQYIDRIEAGLLTLSPEDFKTFCIGDDKEMEAIAKRHEDLRIASIMFDAFAAEVDYWPHPYQCAG